MKSMLPEYVLLIQVESLNAWLLDVMLDGHPVMPNLRQLRDKGAFFLLLDQVSIGRSSDADLLALCSQHPLPTAPVSVVRTENDVVALPALLRERGWSTLSYTCDSPDFWMGARRRVHYGFQRSVFSPELGDPSTPQCDRVLFERVRADLETTDQPFFAWVVTLSMHSPYDPPPGGSGFARGELSGTRLGGFLDLAHDTDEQIGRLLRSLAAAGRMDNTLVRHPSSERRPKTWPSPPPTSSMSQIYGRK